MTRKPGSSTIALAMRASITTVWTGDVAIGIGWPSLTGFPKRFCGRSGKVPAIHPSGTVTVLGIDS